MRDIVLLFMVGAGLLATIKRPWIGVMLWTWLSIMNPHRYTYGIAYSAPLAAATAGILMLCLLITKERESPFKGPPVTFFVAFVCWITLSWLFGFDVSGDYDQWKKIMKIDVMIIVALMLLHSKQHIFAMLWVCVGSLALLGIKGGIFTITTAGAHRVWGPPGSFIEDNNEFALSLVMTIPLIRFLQLQLKNRWGRFAMSVSMFLCAVAAIGTHSRGALVAITAMAVTLWWRGKKKFGMGIFLGLSAVFLAAFMPEEWYDRMSTINTYQEDGSAMGRISAWWTAWGIAKNHLFGVGFNAARPELFALYSPVPSNNLVAHSIYFQVMGHHGFIGLFLFLAIGAATWRSAAWLRNHKTLPSEALWVVDLGNMIQVSMVGFAVGGAFLSLAYFDLIYNMMVVIVITRIWVEKQRWKTEPMYAPGWRTIPGLASAPKTG